MGNTFSAVEVMPHSPVKYGVALLGSELAMVEFMTVATAVVKTNSFFFCAHDQQFVLASQQSVTPAYSIPIVRIFRVGWLPSHQLPLFVGA